MPTVDPPRPPPTRRWQWFDLIDLIISYSVPATNKFLFSPIPRSGTAFFGLEGLYRPISMTQHQGFDLLAFHGPCLIGNSVSVKVPNPIICFLFNKQAYKSGMARPDSSMKSGHSKAIHSSVDIRSIRQIQPSNVRLPSIPCLL